MVYTLYQTTNVINRKIYVGVHKTNNPMDSYLGSGKSLKAAIKKYGRHNFEKKILETFNTIEAAYHAESVIVDNEFVDRPDTYNQVRGGCISPDYSLERKMAYSRRFQGENHPQWGKKQSAESNEKRSLKLKGRKMQREAVEKSAATRRGKPSPCRGRSQSKASNTKRSEAHKELEKVQCPICSKQISPQNAARWHFEKCVPRRYAKDRLAQSLEIASGV